jgi:hypothetical protein
LVLNGSLGNLVMIVTVKDDFAAGED